MNRTGGDISYQLGFDKNTFAIQWQMANHILVDKTFRENKSTIDPCQPVIVCFKKCQKMTLTLTNYKNADFGIL